MTAREGIALDATIQHHPVQDSTEVVSLLISLDKYEVLGGIQNYEDLGLYYLGETNVRLLALRDYIDLDKLDKQYETQYLGRFVGGCYVVYPREGVMGFYDEVNLPGLDYSWSLRSKLVFSTASGGVWLALPDYNDIMDVRPGEIQLALDILGVQTVRKYTLLETRCSLPEITGLKDAHRGRLRGLIYDGQNLGFILQKQNRGREGFLQAYLQILEYEHCATLPAVLDLAQNLNRCQVVRANQLQDIVWMGLHVRLGCVDRALSGCIDLERYGLDLLRKKSYTLTEDRCAYIAKQQTQSQAPQQTQQM